MEPEGVKLSFACGPGMCDMDTATTQDGPRIFAGGAEGIVKAYAPDNLEGAVADLNLDHLDTGDDGFAVTAVAVSPRGEELAVGLKNGAVKLFALPSLELKSILTRFTAPVTGLAYGMKDGGVIAACSEEPGIKLVRRSDSGKILTLVDLNGGTKSVNWDPRGEFLAASGFDGTVRVWKIDPTLDDLGTDLVHSASYFDKEAPTGSVAEAGPGFEHLGKISWHPEGKSLAVTGSPDPLMLSRESWERSMIVPEDAEQGGHVKGITVAAFCPDGRHLATAALDGRVVVWDTQEKVAVRTFVNIEQENWRHLKWLNGTTVAALSAGGSVCTLRHNRTTTQIVKSNTKTKNLDKNISGTADTYGEKAEEDGEEGGAEDRRKRGSFKHLVDEEAAEDNDGDSASNADTAEVEDGAEDVAVGDVTADLDESLSGGGGGGDGDERGPYDGGEIGGGFGVGEGMLDVSGGMDSVAMVPRVDTTPLQDPFQPSSTPLGDARRYLCWNRFGTIISVDENTHNAVEIEFADKSAGRNQRFMDTWNFVMGALSSTGAVFASLAQEDDESSLEPSPSGGRSVLYYKSLGRRSSGEDWTRMMPKGENVLAVSVGRGWAAAATDRQVLRIFTASGLQGETVMLPGPVVTMVGGGDVLMVIFHKGEPLGDSQNLGYQLLDVAGMRELSKGAVCLSPGSELTWLGASEEGMMVAMDSTGLVAALTRSFGWQWTPLLDTLKVSKNKKDRFWPVGVVTGKLLAATLKGGEEHPAAYPRPVLTTVILTALCTQSQDGRETAMFEKSFPAMEARVRQRKFNLDRGIGMGDDDVEGMERELMAQQASLDTVLVKRIQEACADEKAERAMDLAALLHLEKSYSIAIKVANHHGLTALAAGMEDAMVAKFQGPEGDEDFDEDDDQGVEMAGDGGFNRGGGSGGAPLKAVGWRGGQEEQNLGPLDRARLEDARRNKKESVPPPAGPRAAVSAAAGDRFDGEDDSASDEAEIVDSDGDGDDTTTAVFPKAKGSGSGGGKRLLRNEEEEEEEEAEGEDGGEEEEEEEEEEEAEEEMAAPPAPRNPFARGGETFASPPRKKRKDVLETMSDLRASPSPVSAKRPPLNRLSSFAAEARHKNRKDRNIL